MKMNEAFRPGIVLCEAYFKYQAVKNTIANAIARVADESFYECIEITDIKDASDRKCIGSIIHSHDLILTQWMTRLLQTEGLNLSSFDQSLRKKSVARIKEHLGPAVECGTHKIGVLSGPDPGPAQRVNAKDALYTSLCEIAEAIKGFGPIYLILESLDRGAHKNGLIGPTSEAVALIQRVQQTHPRVGLCWDISHVKLCGDDIFKSLVISKPYITQIHLANPVLDRKRSDFGDYHIPFGEPGFLTIQKIAEFFQMALDIELLVKQRPCISVEVRTPRNIEPWETVAQGRSSLQKAWSLFLRPRQQEREKK